MFFLFFHLYIVSALFLFFIAENAYRGEDVSKATRDNFLFFRCIVQTIVVFFLENSSASYTDVKKKVNTDSESGV